MVRDESVSNLIRFSPSREFRCVEPNRLVVDQQPTTRPACAQARRPGSTSWALRAGLLHTPTTRDREAQVVARGHIFESMPEIESRSAFEQMPVLRLAAANVPIVHQYS